MTETITQYRISSYSFSYILITWKYLFETQTFRKPALAPDTVGGSSTQLQCAPLSPVIKPSEAGFSSRSVSISKHGCSSPRTQQPHPTPAGPVLWHSPALKVSCLLFGEAELRERALSFLLQ